MSVATSAWPSLVYATHLCFFLLHVRGTYGLDVCVYGVGVDVCMWGGLGGWDVFCVWCMCMWVFFGVSGVYGVYVFGACLWCECEGMCGVCVYMVGEVGVM